MRILIVDDSGRKVMWIKEFLEERNIQYEHSLYLTDAFEKIFIKNEEYNGIILDMQFPIYKNSQAKGRSGEILLRELTNKNLQIPVLGNSLIDFSDTEYAYFHSQINGFINRYQVSDNFLKQIERQS